MSEAEFSRPIDARRPPAGRLDLSAGAQERKALAARFGIVAIDRLEAQVALDQEGETVNARGRLTASIVQSCSVSGEDLAATIDEPLELRFVPDRPIEAEELELDAEALDEIPYQGTSFDLGEAIAQTLALAIEPYPIGPEAERARREAGLTDEGASGPFAALAALKKP